MKELTEYLDYLKLSERRKREFNASKEELFCSLFKVVKRNIEGYKRVRLTTKCDTPTVLYRVLYLFFYGKKTTRISDMYDENLVWLLSKDKKVLIEIFLYKFEIHIAYYTKPEYITKPGMERYTKLGEPQHAFGLIYDNLATREILDFINVIEDGLTEQVYRIYPENNFEV